MTPNLKRLFADSKRRPHMNDVEIITHIRAKEARRKILDTHGAALIAALEESLDAMKRVQPQVRGALPRMDIESAVSSANKLLTTLEAEAQP